jgi:hypothetical protein
MVEADGVNMVLPRENTRETKAKAEIAMGGDRKCQNQLTDQW